MTEAEILQHVQGLIDDPDGDFCAPPELRLHLYDVAIDLSKRSRVMRRTQAVAYDADQAILTLPEDCYEVLRIVDANYDPLVEVSHADLPRRFETNRGPMPLRYYRDLTGIDELGLDPIPSKAGNLILTYTRVQVAGSNLIIPSQYHLSLIYGAAAKALIRSSNPIDAPKMQQYAAAYEAGVLEAANDANRDFSNLPQRVRPWRD